MSIALCVFLFFPPLTGKAQNSPCTANTPHFTIDLTGQPKGTYVTPLIGRQGLCCDAVKPDACLMATILLDSNAVGIKFSIASGAVPPGALYYQIGCSAPTQVGEQICLDGPGPHILTFCKPGNNENAYMIESIPMTIIPDTVDVTIGCSTKIGTLGYFVDTTLKWTDLSSSDGRYLEFLDCTVGCDTVEVTPDYTAPDFITYQVCGTLIDTICQDLPSHYCKEVTVRIHRLESVEIAAICQRDAYVLPDGRVVDTSGQYVSQLASSMGCDSIVYTELTVHPVYDVQEELTACDGTFVQGRFYTASGLIRDSFFSVNGCDSVIHTELTINYSDTTYQKQEYCERAIYNGKWYGTSQVITSMYTNRFGCDSTVLFDLVIHKSKQTQETVRSCDSVVVKGTLYFNSQTRIDSLFTKFGCDSVHRTEIMVSISTWETADATICKGEAFTLPDRSKVTEAGVYESILQTVNGCDSIIETQLSVLNTGYVGAPDVEKCLGDIALVEAGTGPDIIDYQWSTGDRTPFVQTVEIGTLYLRVEAGNGCSSKDTIEVLDAYCPPCPVYTPTAFTPNQTDLNESFTPVHACDLLQYRLDIYSRWGEHLFSTETPGVRWDGTYMGQMVQQDVYVWILNYKDTHSLIPISQKGTVTVMY